VPDLVLKESQASPFVKLGQRACEIDDRLRRTSVNLIQKVIEHILCILQQLTVSCSLHDPIQSRNLITCQDRRLFMVLDEVELAHDLVKISLEVIILQLLDVGPLVLVDRFDLKGVLILDAGQCCHLLIFA
jgi:hypothetical protein